MPLDQSPLPGAHEVLRQEFRIQFIGHMLRVNPGERHQPPEIEIPRLQLRIEDNLDDAAATGESEADRRFSMARSPLDPITFVSKVLCKGFCRGLKRFL